MFGKYDIMN